MSGENYIARSFRSYVPNIIRLIKPRKIRWEGNVARVGDRRGAYGVWVGRPDGKRQLGRLRRT
jgi:hypothetical protein